MSERRRFPAAARTLIAFSLSLAACADARDTIAPQFDHLGDEPHWEITTPLLDVSVRPVQETFSRFGYLQFEIRIVNNGAVARDVSLNVFPPRIGNSWFHFALQDNGETLPLPDCPQWAPHSYGCTIDELVPGQVWGILFEAQAAEAECSLYVMPVMAAAGSAVAYGVGRAELEGCIPPAPAPDLRLMYAASPRSVQRGEPMSFTMTLLNTGFADADGTLGAVLEGTLPTGPPGTVLHWSVTSARSGSMLAPVQDWTELAAEEMRQCAVWSDYRVVCPSPALPGMHGFAVTLSSPTFAAACGSYVSTASVRIYGRPDMDATTASAQIVGCTATEAHAGGPYVAVEGSLITFDASRTSNAGFASYLWDFGDGTTGTGVMPSHAYADNGSYTARVTVGSAVADAVVTVSNAAPVVHAIALPADPVAIGAPVVVSGTYSDAGAADTHTVLLTWAGGSSAGAAAAGAFHGSLTFAAPGVYALQAAVTDDDGGVGTRMSTQDSPGYVVVYDPRSGFVTGGGWVESPAGAYAPDAAAAGRATFGFVARYERGSSQPAGHTEFRFQAGGLTFASNTYEWLVVAGARAQLKGRGEIHGAGDYGFMLTAVDGQIQGGGGVDRFRIRIWDRATGAVLYDNQLGADDGALPTTALGGGSIVIRP